MDADTKQYIAGLISVPYLNHVKHPLRRGRSAGGCLEEGVPATTTKALNTHSVANPRSCPVGNFCEDRTQGVRNAELKIERFAKRCVRRRLERSRQAKHAELFI
jgi:hypothetical protein